MWRISFAILSAPMATVAYDRPGAVTDFERILEEALRLWAELSQGTAQYSCCISGIVWEG